MTAHISVVIPLLDEEGTLEKLHAQLSEVLGELGNPYEILFIDDGSTDRSGSILDQLAEEDPHVGVIHFRRNFGKAAALDAGFREATGDIILTMDADLQDDPHEIPKFLAEIEKGADLVSGWKQHRHDPLDKTLPSKVFNAILSKVSGLQLNDFNCGFKAYRAEVAQAVNLYGELHRFVPVLAFWRGFRVSEIAVQHHPRTSGVSKYGVERMAKGFFDLLTVLLNTRYRSRPLHLFGGAGTVLGLLGGSMLFYLFAASVFGIDAMRPRPLLYMGLMLLTVGVQLVSTGLLAELVNRTGEDSQARYAVRRFMAPQQRKQQ